MELEKYYLILFCFGFYGLSHFGFLPSHMAKNFFIFFICFQIIFTTSTKEEKKQRNQFYVSYFVAGSLLYGGP